MAKPIKWSRAQLWRWYVEERQTLTAIAAMMNCTESAVRRRMQGYGIERRSQGGIRWREFCACGKPRAVRRSKRAQCEQCWRAQDLSRKHAA